MNQPWACMLLFLISRVVMILRCAWAVFSRATGRQPRGCICLTGWTCSRDRRWGIGRVNGRRIGRHFGAGQSPIFILLTTKLVNDVLQFFLIWLQKESKIILKDKLILCTLWMEKMTNVESSRTVVLNHRDAFRYWDSSRYWDLETISPGLWTVY